MSDTSDDAAKRPALHEDGESIAPPPDTIDLERDAPTFASAYGLVHIEADQQRELVSVASLPPWPVPAGETPVPTGHGIGGHLSEMLGHGIAAGEMIAIGAATAGAGKTAWLMQLVDGLALRNVRIIAGEEQWGRALTPVLIASEMGIDALSWRTLARWTGHSAYIFRGGRTILDRGGREADRARESWIAAKRALAEGSELDRARHWIRVVAPTAIADPVAKGPATFVDRLQAIVEAFRERVACANPGREIVPIVVLDPLQRFLGAEDEIAGMNALARHLAAATLAKRWIALETSDTNKSSAKGEKTNGASDVEEGAGVFRGSYNLMHEVTAALYLRKPPKWEPDEDQERNGERRAEVVIVKQRWGYAAPPWPRYLWQGPTLRFYPMTRERAAQDAQLDRDKYDAKKASGAKQKNDATRKPAEEIDNDRLPY